MTNSESDLYSDMNFQIDWNCELKQTSDMLNTAESFKLEIWCFDEIDESVTTLEG